EDRPGCGRARAGARAGARPMVGPRALGRVRRGLRARGRSRRPLAGPRREPGLGVRARRARPSYRAGGGARLGPSLDDRGDRGATGQRQPTPDRPPDARAPRGRAIRRGLLARPAPPRLRARPRPRLTGPDHRPAVRSPRPARCAPADARPLRGRDGARGRPV
ncbi:MAG: hypothetical protein AVDCRST_MAG45-440, partial [uncultured Solirubrobacterales bacterium]